MSDPWQDTVDLMTVFATHYLSVESLVTFRVG